MTEIKFTEHELTVLDNALHTAWRIYREDVELCKQANQVGLADQFRKQVQDVDELLEKLVEYL